MLLVAKKLFDAWNGAGLCYCHWKSNEHLNPGLDGKTDLDVLLAEKDWEAGRNVLESMDFLRCRSQFGSRYPGVEDWMGFDRETGKLVHVHLHDRLATGHKGLKEYSLPWVEEMLESRIREEETGVFIAHPVIEIVTLYVRIALKVSLADLRRLAGNRYRVDEGVAREIDYLKKRVDWDEVASFLRLHCGDRAETWLAAMQAKELRSEDVARLRKMAEKQFLPVNRFGRWNRCAEFYYRQAVRVRKFLRKKTGIPLVCKKVPLTQSGLEVAFLGQDGAGKTTVTSDIRKWWGWKMSVRYLYMGSGENYSSWRGTLQKRLPDASAFKMIKAWLQLSKYKQLAKDVLSKTAAGQEFSGKGELVIYDRYPQVAFPGICDGPKIREKILPRMPARFARLFRAFADKEEKFLKRASEHKPDIVFKLLIPPEESVRRKPENKLESMVRKHEIIKSLSFEGAEVYLIDATMPYDEEILQIKQIIWDHIRKS